MTSGYYVITKCSATKIDKRLSSIFSRLFAVAIDHNSTSTFFPTAFTSIKLPTFVPGKFMQQCD